MALYYLRSAVSTVRERGIVGALKKAYEDGYLNSVLDGNLFNTIMRHPGSTLIGTDEFGNKYFEKVNKTQFGRHRWVEYADKRNYDASTVPPEWHGWLHYISDFTPDQLQALRPSYGRDHEKNHTGEGDDKIYHAKGHAMNPSKRDWTKVDTWHQ